MYFPRIEDLRLDSDKKQYEIAAYLHLNREVYRRYEKGEREIPCLIYTSPSPRDA